MRMLRLVGTTMVALAAACSDDGGGPGLADFYPETPAPTGEAQAVFAGEITAANPGELLTGPAAQGQVGDFFLRNDRVRFVISAPARVLGVVPQGGNVIDASLVISGDTARPDHFGELSMVYKVGRTCEHTRMEIVQDGSGGGAAVLRAIGESGNNDFINLRGIGVLPIDEFLVPDADDGIACATTYVLHPGTTKLEVYWSLFNDTGERIAAPFGMLNDTGGETEAWSNGRGFERAGIEALSSLTTPAPIDYVVYQGPQVAYGVLPHLQAPARSAGFIIAGVSIVLFGADTLFDIFDEATYQLQLEPRGGKLQHIDLVLGNDANQIDQVWREDRGEALLDVTGMVAFPGGVAAEGARVGVYQDLDGDGAIGAMDVPVSYLDVGGGAGFTGKIPATGDYLLRAELKDVGRSNVTPARQPGGLIIPAPVRLDYQIIDDATNQPMPGRLLVVGTHPVFPDKGVFETYDRQPGVVRSIHAVTGSTTGGLADPPVFLPPGGTYRVYASRGTEWSTASASFGGTADGSVTLRLRRVVDTTGYVASDFHVHQVASPDSPVGSVERVRSALSAGVELFAVTDHDVVSDLQPIVEDLAVEDLLRVVPGIEITPFAYGHFNAYPMTPMPGPNGGAVDWGRGAGEGFAMTPREIFDAARGRGARVVEVNHPRGTSTLAGFQSFFDRANLQYDFGARSIFGDFANADVPNDWLRLPPESLWSDAWNALEVWNGFKMEDTDLDGRREIVSMDIVLRDWFNMLSLGLYVVPVGNSDTHSSVADPLGMPRTMVRVPDDTAASLMSGGVVDGVMRTLEGTQTARDVVITNGPMIAVTSGGMPAIGRSVGGAGGTVTLQVTITAPAWADFDTLEVFANATPPTPLPDDTASALVPLRCWSSRAPSTVDPADPCLNAELPPAAMTVTSQTLGTHRFLRAVVTVTIDAADIPARAGATGTDAWLVFRARGDKAIFPIYQGDLLSEDPTLLEVLTTGTPAEIDDALRGVGVPAAAFTAPVFIDYDGGGYRAPFQP